ncbi:MAG: outer membrane protein transport protein [Capnocytophaga sp.]|nr:outer membrane protein transport protein [Capnocytophaga sp.]
MKRLILSAALLAAAGSYAQNEIDALRYSQEELYGTARYRAMSGAFGALGGDFSGFSINPAGSSVFANGAIALTLGGHTTKSNASFFNNGTSTESSDLNADQIGTVFVFKDGNPGAKFNKFSIGINYQRTRNYEDNLLAYSGTNTNASIADYFGSMAAGFQLGDLRLRSGESISSAYREIGINGGYAMQQAFLGYQGWLIEPDTDNDSEIAYHSNALLPVNQQYRQETYGGDYKFTTNFSFLYNNTFHLGANLNFHRVAYRQFTRTIENATDTSPASRLQNANFRNELQTNGEGVSLQIGGIYKVTDELRLGLAYQSPTWYRLNDETVQSLSSQAYDDNGVLQSYSLNPNIVNLYDDYRLSTPSEWTASLAYVFGKRGLISVDYQYKNYANMKYRTKNAEQFVSTNEVIRNTFGESNVVRIGGEFKALPALSLRAGYRFESSPYKNNALMGDLNGYSLGLGYDFGGFAIDVAYNRSKRDWQHQMYDTGLTDRAQINSTWSNFVVTAIFKL